ncbi:MAG: PLP-dependent cysteine synthase family protein [Planctomycetota bacterium]|jgi:cysteine synthase
MTKQNRVYESIVDLIANPENPTPMVKIGEKINPNRDFTLYLKLERYNPFGSVKDRIALSMLEGLEIEQGISLVEPSSGNTGIALAALANAKGIPIEIAVPERIPEEKKTILKLLGVQTLWEADDTLCPVFPNEGARGLVNAMLKSKGGEKYVSPNQYENELNVQAHYENTGPEIWKQTDGKIDYFFAGFGTCGTDLTEDLVPKILDKSVIDDTVTVDDEDAYQTGIQLARQEGILVGPTTGAIVYAALQYARSCKGLAVAISPDDAFKYISFYGPYVKKQGQP